MTLIKHTLAVLLLLPMAASSQDIEDSLRKAALYLEPVEVKALRATENAPFAKSTITKKDISKANLGQDLPYILNTTPSVIVNSDAGNGIGYTGFRIRGSDATRINMTINGIPYNDAESQGLFFVNLPDLISSVNDIQIQRGIGASSNGAGAFGASMNFSTNDPKTNHYAEINNTAGSFNTWKHTVKLGTGLINDHFTVDARLSRINSDGYIDRAETGLQSFFLSGAWLSSNSSLRLNVFSGKERTYQAWNGISQSDLATNRRYNYSGTEKPGTPYDNETDNYQQDHYQLLFNHRFNSNLEFNTAAFLTRGKGYYENYKAAESFSGYGLPDPVISGETVTETDLVRQLWLDNYFYGQIASVQYKTNRGILTAGGGWNRYDGHHFGEVVWAQTGFPVKYRWYDLNAKKTDVNVYTKYQHKVTKKLELFGDLQYRRVDYNLGGFRNNPSLLISNIYNFFNPKAGLAYSIKAGRLYASIAHASKEPNRDDFEAGKEQQPKPEKMTDLEAGFEKNYQRWKWNTNFFYMNYRDQLIPTGKINDVGAYTRINIPESFRAGIELMAEYNPTNWLSAGANATFSRNRLKNFTEFFDDYDNGGQGTNFFASSDIAYSPSFTGAATLSIRPFSNAEIFILGKYISRQFLDNTSNDNRSLDPYYIQDLRLSYAIPFKKIKSLRAILQINNLLNKKYEANGYSFSYRSEGKQVAENYYFPQAGTNLLFALNLEL